MLVCGIVLVNVAVAVLLEKMVDVGGEGEVEGVTLKDLPESAQSILSALDTDGDGVLTRVELRRAAELLRRDEAKRQRKQQEQERRGPASGPAPAIATTGGGGDDHSGDEAPSFNSAESSDDGADTHRRAEKAANEIARRLAAAAKEDSTLLRLQIERTQSDLLNFRNEAMAREALLLEQMRLAGEREVALQQSIKAIADNMTAIGAARPRKRPSPASRAATRPQLDGSAAHGGASGAEEDRLQDGERVASKQAPERVQQRL